MTIKNVVVLGKGDLAIRASDWFLNSNQYNLIYVVPDMPEPKWTNSLTDWCKLNNINFIESGDYKNLPNINIDLAVSIFYGKIIKQDFIDKCGNIINLHNAPLPKYRGVRPINWALKNNEIYHGITIHKIHEGIDDGDVLGSLTYPIYPEIEEVEDVYNKALQYGFLLFQDVISKIDYCLENAIPQSEINQEPSYYSNKENSLLQERGDFRR